MADYRQQQGLEEEELYILNELKKLRLAGTPTAELQSIARYNGLTNYQFPNILVNFKK